jgi:DNA-binding protein HU-beta
MNKSELVSYVAEKYQTSKVEGEKFVNKFTEVIEDVLAKGDSINLIGFGSFEVKKIPARDGRNPKTGLSLQIKAHNRPVFKAGKNLKDKVNK